MHEVIKSVSTPEPIFAYGLHVYYRKIFRLHQTVWKQDIAKQNQPPKISELQADCLKKTEVSLETSSQVCQNRAKLLLIWSFDGNKCRLKKSKVYPPHIGVFVEQWIKSFRFASGHLDELTTRSLKAKRIFFLKAKWIRCFLIQYSYLYRFMYQKFCWGSQLGVFTVGWIIRQ